MKQKKPEPPRDYSVVAKRLHVLCFGDGLLQPANEGVAAAVTQFTQAVQPGSDDEARKNLLQQQLTACGWDYSSRLQALTYLEEVAKGEREAYEWTSKEKTRKRAAPPTTGHASPGPNTFGYRRYLEITALSQASKPEPTAHETVPKPSIPEGLKDSKAIQTAIHTFEGTYRTARSAQRPGIVKNFKSALTRAGMEASIAADFVQQYERHIRSILGLVEPSPARAF